MALFKCPDCGWEISESAFFCPNCGRLTFSGNVYVLAVTLGIIIIAFSHIIVDIIPIIIDIMHRT